MTRQLLWDAGPGEMRAGLLENEQLVEFRIIRQRRQKALHAAGEIYTARIVERIGSQRALVSLGGDVEALLEHPGALPQGALLAVQMIRAPVPEPGRWKRAIVRAVPDIASQKEPGWHFSDEPWVTFLQKMADQVEAIICADAAIANEVRGDLGDQAVSVQINAEAIADADFDSLIEAAVIGEFPIAGGMLSIERTRAMTLIDIDGSGDPLALNLAAANEIPRLLRLLDIGGQIGIDFLAMKDRSERQAVDAALAEACGSLGQHERTALNGFGFCQIVRPRTGPSIPDIMCGTARAQLSLESRAIALLRTVGRSVGHGTRQLIAPPAVIELIRQWPEETGALRFSLGVEIELVPDATATGYGYVHVSPA